MSFLIEFAFPNSESLSKLSWISLSSSRSSITPPISVLCCRSGELIFKTTGFFIFFQKPIASSDVCANVSRVIGIPAVENIFFASNSDIFCPLVSTGFSPITVGDAVSSFLNTSPKYRKAAIALTANE